MLEIKLTIKNKLGLHARPSALLAKTAGLFRSSITLTSGKRTVDAKSILGLMTMALPCGTELTLSVDGPDEKLLRKASSNSLKAALVKKISDGGADYGY